VTPVHLYKYISEINENNSSPNLVYLQSRFNFFHVETACDSRLARSLVTAYHGGTGGWSRLVWPWPELMLAILSLQSELKSQKYIVDIKGSVWVFQTRIENVAAGCLSFWPGKAKLLESFRNGEAKWYKDKAAVQFCISSPVVLSLAAGNDVAPFPASRFQIFWEFPFFRKMVEFFSLPFGTLVVQN